MDINHSHLPSILNTPPRWTIQKSVCTLIIPLPLTSADPLLEQVPLIKNLAFQPPKPVNLDRNYSQLLPTLQKSVPPGFNFGAEEINQWQSEVDRLKEVLTGLGNQSSQARQFELWLVTSQKTVAPGFTFGGGVMQPNKRPDSPQNINELDRAFNDVSLEENGDSPIFAVAPHH